MKRTTIINLPSDSGERKKEGKKRDFIHQALNILSTPQQGLVGIAEEIERRRVGLPPTSMIEAAKTGMREDYDWSRVIENPVGATVANFVVDPANIVPFTKYPKFAEAAVAGAKAKTFQGIQKVPVLKKIVDEAGQAFVPGYKERHILGFPELADMRVAHQKKLRELMAEKKDPRTDEVMKLVPRYDDRRKIYRLAEEPLDGTSQEWRDWKARIDMLPDHQKKAHQIVTAFFREKGKEKVDTGLLDAVRAFELEHKFGTAYAPRYLATPQDAAKAHRAKAQEALAEITDGMDPKMRSKLERRAKRLNASADEYDNMGVNTLRAQLERNAGKLKEPGFLKKRKLGPLQKLGPLADMFDQDVAVIMEKERADIAKALADKEYLDNVSRFLKQGGFAKTPDEAKDLKDYVQLSKKYKGFEDVYVPKQIADEVGTLVEKVGDPLFAPTTFALWRRLTQAWKGVTLFYAPEFYTRQAVSNVTLNHLAGMGVQDFGHNIAGLKYAKKFILDKAAPDAGEIVMRSKAYPNGITEAAFHKALVREGALGHGLVGEVDDFIRNPTRQKGKVGKAIDLVARDNPVLRKGVTLANAIDGQSKIAHMLWRLSKGDTLEQAGASARKFLYDPDSILTSFEKKYLRDAAAPFWGWVKFNLPLQMEMLAYYPNRIATQLKGMREVENALGGPEPEEAFLPEWMQDASKMRLRWNDQTGNWDFLFLGSWYPFAEMEKLSLKDARAARELWNLVTPLAKEPVEWISGTDTFTFNPIEKFPGERGDVLGIPMRKRLEQAIKFIRPINIADKVMEAYGREVAGTDEARRIASARNQLVFGRVYHVNREQVKKSWEGRIDFRIRELKGIANYYKKKGDIANEEEVREAIKNLEGSKRQLEQRQ